LVNAAKDAVMRWVYTPQSAEVATRVHLEFLGDGSAGQIQQALLIYRTEAEYPIEAKRAGVQGKVTLAATIGTDGAVKSVKGLSGDPLLIAAAEEAVRQWRYRPTMLNGQPVETETQVVVNFAREK
jgi:TonB family protein